MPRKVSCYRESSLLRIGDTLLEIAYGAQAPTMSPVFPVDVERFAELAITLTPILMDANIALVLNKARVAAEIAAENCGSD